MTPERLAEIENLLETGDIGSLAADALRDLIDEIGRLQPKPFGDDLRRVIAETDAQDGTDPEAEDLADSEWAKVKSSNDADFGSPVRVVFVPDLGFEDCEPTIDHGYLTSVPGRDDDWDMVGIVHIPEPFVEKERPIPEWHSLYSLCKNKLVAEIVIGPRPYAESTEKVSTR